MVVSSTTTTPTTKVSTPTTTTMSSLLPRTMKAVQGIDYGDIDEMLHVVKDVPTPPLLFEENDDKMLLQVLTVALAPGDCRVLSGLTRELQGPSQFPYIPGGDCCGIVMALPTMKHKKKNVPSSLPFQVGDRVVARFTEKPMGVLAEYAMVSTLVADKVPDDISSVDAAALISASPIIDLITPIIRNDERILVLGASGGIGAHFCQLLRLHGASYVVGVASQSNCPRLLQSPILCNDAIDYTTTDVYSLEQYQNDPFDTIYDFAGGGYQRLEECCRVQKQHHQECRMIVKPASMGGRFITTVPLHGPTYEIHSIWKALQIFLFPAVWKAIVSRLWTRNQLPKYSLTMAIGNTRTPATKVMEYVVMNQQSSLKAIVDPKGPFPLTTKGIRQAFRLQESRHAFGKVVIRVSESEKFK